MNAAVQPPPERAGAETVPKMLCPHEDRRGRLRMREARVLPCEPETSADRPAMIGVWRSTLAYCAAAFWLSLLGAKALGLLVGLLGDPASMNVTWLS